MKQYIIIPFFLFFIFGINSVYSQESNNTLNIFLFENGFGMMNDNQVNYTFNSDAYSYIITFDKPVTGIFNVKFSKSIPVMVQVDYDGYEHINRDIFFLKDGEGIDFDQNETDCFFNYNISVSNATNIEIISAYVPEWKHKFITVDFDPQCSDTFDSLKKIKEIRVCNDLHTLQFNHKGEQVCINSESVSKLTDRGYLIVS